MLTEGHCGDILCKHFDWLPNSFLSFLLYELISLDNLTCHDVGMFKHPGGLHSLHIIQSQTLKRKEHLPSGNCSQTKSQASGPTTKAPMYFFKIHWSHNIKIWMIYGNIDIGNVYSWLYSISNINTNFDGSKMKPLPHSPEILRHVACQAFGKDWGAAIGW